MIAATSAADSVNLVGAVCGAVLALSAVIILVYKAVRFFDRLKASVEKSEQHSETAANRAEVAATAVVMNGHQNLAADVAKILERLERFEEGQRVGGDILRHLDEKIDETRDRLIAVETKVGEVRQEQTKVADTLASSPLTGELPVTA